MYPEYPNLYQRARKTTLFTQEEAAEQLGLSSESLKQYESGRRIPSDETVSKMCELYDTKWLALEHAKATDQLGVLPDGIQARSLMQAALMLANRLRPVNQRLYRLMDIAEDDHVDETEADDFDDIRALIAANVAAELALLYATEQDTKKERPDGGTSKRSVSQVIRPENDCKNSIAYSRGNASPVLKKGVYAR